VAKLNAPWSVKLRDLKMFVIDKEGNDVCLMSNIDLAETVVMAPVVFLAVDLCAKELSRLKASGVPVNENILENVQAALELMKGKPV
jgi:hypothetical protein